MMINFRTKKILESYREDIKSRQHTLSDNQYQEIYYFCQDENISLPSTEHGLERYKIRIGKLQYIQECNYLNKLQGKNCKKRY